MKTYKIALSLLAGLLISSFAHAVDVGVSVDLGTTGAGLHVTLPLQKDLNARIGYNALNYSYSSSTSSVNYNFDLKLKTVDVLLDWHPTSAGFRLTGGLVAYNGNKINAMGEANNNGTYVLNGNTYNASTIGKVDGEITFRKVAPYLGIGFGNAVAADKGWGFTSDLGVMMQGTPNSTLSNSGCKASVDVCNRVVTDVAAENVKLADKLHNFKFYPVIRFGVSYKF
jgi:hypothetical protein